jgi:hypothetical protein
LKRMGHVRACALFFLICAVNSVAAQDQEPPSGQNVDESRRIELLPQAPAPCVSIVRGEATLLLPRDDLRRLADARPDPAKSDAARLALLQGRRAASLLGVLGNTPDSHGCVSPSRTVAQDDEYVVVDLLKRGRAQVLVTSTGVAVPFITIRYLGQLGAAFGGRGDIMFSMPGVSAPFMLSPWWVV